MPAPVFDTLETLRTELQNRLGFRAAGQTPGINAPIVDSFLRRAQEALYVDFDWNYLETKHDEAVGVDQIYLDYPADADPQRTLRVSVLNGTGWSFLTQGITDTLRTTQAVRGVPTRYELYDQIELWPAPDQLYTVRVWYTKALGRFTLNGDRATVDPRMFFPLALMWAKAHYRQPDAPIYQATWTQVRARLRHQSRGQTRRLSEVSRGIDNPEGFIDPYRVSNPVVVP